MIELSPSTDNTATASASHLLYPQTHRQMGDTIAIKKKALCWVVLITLVLIVAIALIVSFATRGPGCDDAAPSVLASRAPDCFHDDGWFYSGNVSHTVSGLTCAAWISNKDFGDVKHFPGARSIGDVKNFCRNPASNQNPSNPWGSTVQSRPWCFTTDASKEVGDCAISKCGALTSATTPPPTTATPDRGEPWYSPRLPDSIKPTEYTIDILGQYWNTSSAFYNGTVVITADVLKVTHYIQFHVSASKLRVSGVEVQRLSPGSSIWDTLQIEKHEQFQKYDNYLITLRIGLRIGDKISVTVQYHAVDFEGTYQGLYRASHKPDANTENWYMMTQFEPTAARKMFPCFDEPAMKALYKLSVTHLEEHTAHSNTYTEKTVDVGMLEGRRVMKTIFEKTPEPMSTYLVVLVVGKYEEMVVVPRADPRAWSMSLFIPPGRSADAQYAKEISPKLIEFYESYFGVQYKWPKADQIWLPEFRSGAMEHWGLITYRESTLLFNPQTGTHSQKTRVIAVIAHELAHQWFGNLVTMKWWTDLWLNEAFASFMEWESVASVETNWDYEGDKYLEMLHAMGADCLPTTKAVLPKELKSSDDFGEAFSPITYSKGSTLISMFRLTVGREKFRSAMTKYFAKYEFGNTDTNQFVEAVTEEAYPNNATLQKVASDDFFRNLKTPGFPVVTVILAKDAGKDSYQHDILEMSQRPFLLVRNETKTLIGDNRVWRVRLSWMGSDGHEEKAELRPNRIPQRDIQFGAVLDRPVKLNVNQTQMIRVNYPERWWKKWALHYHELKWSRDRAGLLNDALALARAGQLKYSIAMQFVVDALAKETGLLPWKATLSELAYLNWQLVTEPGHETHQRLIRDAAKLAADKLKFENKTDSYSVELANVLLKVLCHYGNEVCLKEADNQYMNRRAHGGPADETKESRWMYTGALLYKNTAERFDEMEELAKNLTDANMKINIYIALTYTRIPSRMARLIRYPEDGLMKDSVWLGLLSRMARNPLGRSMIWNYFRAGFDGDEELVKRFGLESRKFGTSIQDIGQFFNYDDQCDELHAFIKKHPEAGAGTQPRRHIVEICGHNSMWRQKLLPELSSWLQTQ